MKLSMPFKFGIGIVLLFAVLIAGLFLYQPIRYRWLKSQLLSDNSKTRIRAMVALAIDGRRVVPHVHRWLKSEDEKLAIAACEIVRMIEGDIWKEFLPDLTEILEGNPSGLTDAAAEVVYKRGNVCEEHKERYEFIWNVFSEKKKIKRNICMHILASEEKARVRICAASTLSEIGDMHAYKFLLDKLENDADSIVRGQCARALANIGDSRAVEPLIKALKREPGYGPRQAIACVLGNLGDNRAIKPLIQSLANDPVQWVRTRAAYALCNFDDSRVIDPLLKALSGDNSTDVRQNAADALGNIGDKRAVKPLIATLENDQYYYVRCYAAFALGKIGGERAFKSLMSRFNKDPEPEVHSWIATALGRIGNPDAVEPLIAALSTAQDNDVRTSCAEALGAIGDSRAVEPLIAALENDKTLEVRMETATALAGFENEKIDAALSRAHDNGNLAAALAIGWRNEGVGLGNFKESDFHYSYLDYFMADARARWGNAAAIERIIFNLPYSYVSLRRYHADVLGRMPEGFPDFDFKSNRVKCKRQVREIEEWYRKHRHRLAWDKEKRKYYLKPEPQPKKGE